MTVRTSLRPLIALLRADLANIGRDPLLAGGATMAMIPGLLLFAFGSNVEQAGLDFLGVSDLHLALGAFAVLIGPALIGWIFGFLLLEDRDENVLLALEITPLGKSGFIAYRLAMAFSLSLVIAAVVARLALPDISTFQWIGLALVSSLHAIATALFLVGFAANKVEGLALTKLVNFALVAPFVALAPAPWRWLAGVVPPFWLGEMLELGPDSLPIPLALALGVLMSLFVTVLLYLRMRRRLG